MTLRLLDTFSGIGGFSLAARWCGGFETVQFIEREPFCQQILRKHWPDVPIHDDICTYSPPAGVADVVVGGFPCQDISQAGAGAGIREGTRSGLFYELMRVVRLVGPQFVVLENVAAITHRGLDIVLGELAEAGFDAEWACIKASDVGACHQRDRWWCVAYPQGQQRHDGGSADPAEPAGAAAEPGDGDSADAPHPHRERCGQQFPPSLAAREGQPAWPDTFRRLNPDWTGYASQPVIRRGDDGFSGRVDRLKALGNAVVHQVAMIPLLRVLELAHGR
jgi:DNA (cytosine-5)-methyltransferase 1